MAITQRNDEYLSEITDDQYYQRDGVTYTPDFAEGTLDCVSMESMVCLEQIHAIDKLRVLKYLGKITREQMSEVEDAAMKSLGMPIPECVEAP